MEKRRRCPSTTSKTLRCDGDIRATSDVMSSLHPHSEVISKPARNALVLKLLLDNRALPVDAANVVENALVDAAARADGTWQVVELLDGAFFRVQKPKPLV